MTAHELLTHAQIAVRNDAGDWGLTHYRYSMWALMILDHAKRHLAGKSTPRNYTTMERVGTARYVVNFHDGHKTHADSSPFYDVKIFSSAVARDRFLARLREAGYVPRGYGEGEP